MKWIIYASIMLSILPAMAQNEVGGGQKRRHGGGRPHLELTDEQKQCLSDILGEPGQGERPSHDAMESAFQQCNISKLSGGRNQNSENGQPSGPPRNLTDEQISCLESKLGKFGEGEPPTEQAFIQAHSDCGVELPPGNSENQ